jgi:hypothetical protein
LRVGGEEFELAEADGDWQNFDPRAHGLPLRFVGTHCWDGWVCEYRVDDRLLLDMVGVGWSRAYGREGGPSLFGRRARKVRDVTVTWARFEALAHPVVFTGSLLVGQDSDDYGLLAPFYTYRRAVELRFERGRLVERADVTAELERYRRARESLPPPPLEEPGDPPDLSAYFAWRQQTRSYRGFFSSRRREAGLHVGDGEPGGRG